MRVRDQKIRLGRKEKEIKWGKGGSSRRGDGFKGRGEEEEGERDKKEKEPEDSYNTKCDFCKHG